MDTERYMITFFGVNSKFFTDDYVSYLWEQSANKEYNNSQIYVTAIVGLCNHVCGELRGCTLGSEAHIIIATRNPHEAADSNLFLNSLKNIIQEIREQLGNPNMTMIVQKAEFYYFYQI